MPNRLSSWLQEVSGIHCLPAESCHRRLQKTRRDANEEHRRRTERPKTRSVADIPGNEMGGGIGMDAIQALKDSWDPGDRGARHDLAGTQLAPESRSWI
jgi:hypothetical protein